MADAPKAAVSSPAPALHRSRSFLTRELLVPLALTLLVWAVFAQTFHFDFVNFDDDKYIYDDPHVTQPVSLTGLGRILIEPDSALWHPLTTVSHILDVKLFGLRAGWHHLVNVFLQNIAAVLLFAALRQMTGAFWRSAFVAAVYAVHPLRVESVVWITERKDVLTGIFLALTFLAYRRYAAHPSFGRYVVVAACVAGGIMSKPTFLMVPIALLAIDYWPLRCVDHARDWLRLIVEKLPLIALSAGAFVQTIIAQSVTLPSLEQLAVLPRIKNAVVSIVIYLRQLFWPTRLAIFYPHPHDQLGAATVLSCLCLVIAITAFAWWRRRSQPYLIVGWAWWLIMLFPALGFIQAGLQGHADRFTHLAHIGISMIVSWAAVDLTATWPNRQIILGICATVIVMAMAVVSFKQATYWRDSVTLWQRDLAVADDSYIAEQNLAAALWKRGEKTESKMHAHRAQVVRWATAVRDYPEDVKLSDNLGVALIQSGDVAAAVRQWERSIAFDPNDGNALNNVAWVLATSPNSEIRNGARAVEYAQRAAQLSGGDQAMLLRTLAAAYAEAGDFSNATATVDRAIEMATARNNDALVQTLRNERGRYTAGEPYRESTGAE